MPVGSESILIPCPEFRFDVGFENIPHDFFCDYVYDEDYEKAYCCCIEYG